MKRKKIKMYPTSINTGTNKEERKAFIQSNLLNNDWLKSLIYNYNNLVGSGLLMPSFLGSINIHDFYMRDKVIQKICIQLQSVQEQIKKKEKHSFSLTCLRQRNLQFIIEGEIFQFPYFDFFFQPSL